jgi:cobalt-zinc-cadmium efflux system membrane fusion protein
MKFAVRNWLVSAGCGLVIMGAFAVRHVIAARDTATETAARKTNPGVVQYAPGSPQLSSLQIVTAEELPLPVSAPVNARITYDENVTARISSSIAGRVVGIDAEVGDHVKRHAVLARIDSPDFASADADWRKAQADERRKKLALERAKDLFEHEILARKDLESAQADYEQAAAETRRAALRMQNLHGSGQENGIFALRSPIDGVVADRQVNPGLEVRPDLQNPLFVITDIRRLWVVADVPERTAADIKPGQEVVVEADAFPGEQFIARVDRVGVALDPNTRRVQVRVALPNADGRLRPEMFVRMAFVADGRMKAVRVQNTALFVDGLHTFAFVEKAPGTFEKRRISIALRDARYSYLERGIAAGERVVSEGALLLNSEAGSDAQ